MTAKKTAAKAEKAPVPDGFLYLVWDPINNLIHGVHQFEEDAVAQIRKLAGQPAPHGPLHVVKAPGPDAKPKIRTDDLNDLAVRAQ